MQLISCFAIQQSLIRSLHKVAFILLLFRTLVALHFFCNFEVFKEGYFQSGNFLGLSRVIVLSVGLNI